MFSRSGKNSSEAEFKQYRCPLGGGPSNRFSGEAILLCIKNVAEPDLKLVQQHSITDDLICRKGKALSVR